MPLCALRKTQTFTRRPKAASRTFKVAARRSGRRVSGQFRVARASASDQFLAREHAADNILEVEVFKIQLFQMRLTFLVSFDLLPIHRVSEII